MKIKKKINILLLLFFIVVLCVSLVLWLGQTSQISFAYTVDKEIDIRKNTNLTEKYLIDNCNYFINNPNHHTNYEGNSKYGVCSTVAMQLILGYHNYYTDRRLVPKTDGGEKIFLGKYYGDLASHPLIDKTHYTGQGSIKLGLCDAVFDEIIELTPLNGIGLDQILSLTTQGANKFLDKYSSTDYDAKLHFSSFSKDTVNAELDAGNPVVLGMNGKDKNGERSYHVVVAYGRARLDGEFGYICHYGWGFDYEQMWAPESLFSYQVIMDVEHEHSYVDSKEPLSVIDVPAKDTHRKLICKTCGCTTVDELYQVNAAGNEIVSLNYEPFDNVNIPSTINGVAITKIGNSVFENSNVNGITFSSMITDIGDYAFKNCEQLTFVKVLDNITSIGIGAFAGCNILDITVSNNNQNYSAQDNILFNKNKTKIIATGKIPSTVNIPNTVTEIAPSAFEGNANLQTLDFGKTTPMIGSRAFADCTNLQKVYFYSYETPYMESNSFANDSFIAYAPYESLGDYNMALNGSAKPVTSIQTVLSYVSDGQVIYQENVYYGSILHSLYLPQRNGYAFDGWYRDESLQSPVTDGVLWEETTNTILYANWDAVEYKIYFNLNGGTLASANPLTYTINDNIIFDKPTKLGNTFTGWTIGGQAVDGISKGTYGDIFVDANWQVNQYTISFDVNGGAPQIQPITVTFGQPFSINIIPTKYGYYLDGWQLGNVTYLKGNGGSERSWDRAENATLTANWSVKEYYISIGDDGKYWLNANGDLVNAPDPIPFGTKLELMNAIDTFKKSEAGFKPGHIFARFIFANKEVNWKNGVPDIGNNGAIVTIEPDWDLETHSIHFHMQVGDDPTTIRAKYGTTIDLPESAPDGYAFDYWSTDKDGVYRVDWKTMPDLTPNEQGNGSCDLYGHVYRNKFSIKYDLDGGVNSVNNPTTYYITSEITLSNPTKTGYTFNGWYLDASKKNKVDKISGMSGDITLYAKWTPNQYTVTLDRQGGTGGAASVNATYGEELKTVTAPSRAGYSFIGYFLQPNKQSDQYYDENMVGIKEWKITGNTRLYALWVPKTYTVKLFKNPDNLNIYSTIKVTYDEKMPSLDGFAPTKTGYAFAGYYANANGGGKQYYKMQFVNSQYDADLAMQDYYWREAAIPCGDVYWNIAGDSVLYAYFVPLEMDYSYIKLELDTENRLGSSKSTHIVHGEDAVVEAEELNGYTFQYFQIGSRQEKSSVVVLTMSLMREPGTQGVRCVSTITAWYKSDECVAQGTLITLADGTQVPVESLKGDEMLLVWNMLTGQRDAARILFIDKDPAQVYKVIDLGFSDGTHVKVISEHGFWDYNLNKYVYLRQDASKYMGHWFNKGDTRVQLTSVEVRDEYTVAYSPVTYGHLCYYVNGMLSMPGGIGGLFNIFQVDPDTMTINVEAMARDIETYGLFTYDEFAQLIPVTESVFNAFNGQYLKVAIGKGLITVEQLGNLVDCYSRFFDGIQ